MKPNHRVVLLTLLFAGSTPLAARAEFSLTKIADSATTPAISIGSVQLDGGHTYFKHGFFQAEQVSRGDGGALTEVVGPSNGVNAFDTLFPFSVDDGDVAFRFGDQILAMNDGSIESIWNINIPLPGAPAPPLGSFPIAGRPTLRNGVVAFRAGHANTTAQPGGLHDGIYTRPLGGGPISTVADRDTEIPDSGGATFASFGIYQLNQFGGFGDNCGGCGAQIDEQGNVIFAGYSVSAEAALPSGGYVREAATGEIREFTTNVTSFNGLSNRYDIADGVISGSFLGVDGAFPRGVLLSPVDGSPFTTPYAAGTPAPGGMESFTRINDTVTLDNGNIAFLAGLPGNHMGLFAEVGGELRRVIDTTMTLDGKTIQPGDFVSGLKLADGGFEGDSIAFGVLFDDLSTAVYRADFSASDPGSSPDDPILPPVDPPPVFGGICDRPGVFCLPIDAGTNDGSSDDPIWIDPDVAVGYDYDLVDGPNVASVTLPTGFGDDSYDLYYLNEMTQQIEFAATLSAMQTFDFTTLAPGGVSRFRVLGIEESAMVDPDDPLGFPTGLTFVAPGAVALTMTAIVPEPASAWLLGACLLAAGFTRRA